MSIVDDLKTREAKAEDDLRRLEEAEEIAKNIANLERAQQVKASTIKRMVSTFGAFSPVDAIYKANEASLKRSDAGKATAAFARSFAKSYADSIANNAKTAWTGRDYTTQQKTYSDIIEKQMGMKKGGASTALGVVGDIATDPLNFIGTPAFKVVSKTAGVIGKEMAVLAAKAPIIEKGMDAFARQFNIFYDIEKLYPKSSVDKFKDAFRVAAESGSFYKLAKLGFDVSKYTKRKHNPDFQKIIPQKFYNVLDQAFGPQPTVGPVGDTLDFTSNVFKRLMSWSPKFQTRNFMGAVTQGLSEMPMRNLSDVGATGKYYYDALRMVVSKGKTDPKVWKQAKDYGLTKSTGMFEQSMDRIPAKIANFGESVNRIALLLSEKSSGKSLAAAVEKTQDVFYKYNKAYLTGTEKTVMSRIFPFYQFAKGQIQYWPEALGRNAAKWTGLGRIKEGTKSDTEKEYPFLTPDYWKDMFSVKNVGNIGFQLEDFLKNATGDVKNMWGQLQPLLKGTFELITDWKVFQGKRLSTDISGRGYDKLGNVIGGALYGYNPTTKTVNPYNKWIIDSIAGPIMGPIKALTDSSKSFIDSLLGATTSIRDYNLSPQALSRQKLMQNAEDAKGGFWSHVARRFGSNIGPSSATASTPIPVQIVRGTGFKSAKNIAEWEATYGGGIAGSFGTVRNPDDVGNAQDLEYRSQQKTLDNIIRSAANATNDIGVNAKNVYELEIKQIYDKYKYEGKLGSEQHQQELAWKKAEYATLAPRTYDQSPYLDMATRDKFRRSPGRDALNQFRNKALDEYIAERSKIMELNRSLVVSSPDSINREMKADLKGLDLKYKSQYGYMSAKDYDDHVKAIVEKAGRAMKDLEAKGNTATANLLSTWAKSEVNEIQKNEMDRRAALLKYKGTDEYRMAEAAKNYKFLKEMEAAINAEYDQKRREILTKEAKAHMESVKAMTKGEAEAIIKALEDIYKRGGKSIKDFYNEKLAMRTAQYSQNAVAAIDLAQGLLQSGMKDAPDSIEGRKVKYTINPLRGKNLSEEKIKQISDDFAEVIRISKTLDEFKQKFADFQPTAKGVKIDVDILAAEPNLAQDAFDKLGAVKKIFSDPKTDISKRISAMKEALKLLTQKLQGVDPIAIEEAIKALSDTVNGLTIEGNDAASGITNDTTTVNKSITEIKEYAAKLRAQTYSVSSIRTLGRRTDNRKFGYDTSPYAPAGYDSNQVALKAEMDEMDAAASRRFQANTNQKGDDLRFTEKGINQSDSGYLNQIETELEQHENNKANLSAAGKAKLEALQEEYAAFTIASNGKIAAHERQVFQQRMTTAGDMAGMLTETASMIYEATGKKSKEAFYAMKAIAIVEATIKGVQSVINAYEAGSKINPAVGAAYAAIASAFVGTQVGILTSQMVNGPEAKAEGGPIRGGSGHRDDVPIMAMGGEYVIKKSSVNKYGASFLDALNRGLIPAGAINFSVPALPIYNSSQVHFAEGGIVSGGPKSVPITVELKNESGTKLKQTKSDVQFNGQEYVVSVWLDALERNVGGLRTTLGG